uniref:O-antigen ligase n=1 Tax=viral metagenome TaxID=1070528 RepID=A0A6M3M0L8_9ZZZZ
MGASIIINHAIRTDEYITFDGLIWSVTNLILMYGALLIGKNLYISESKIISFFLAISFAFFCWGTYTYYSAANSTLILPIPDGANPESVATYQSMAVCVLYTFILLGTKIRSKASKGALLSVSIILLYYIGARTELFLALSIAPLYLIIHYNAKKIAAYSSAILLSAVTVSILYGFNDRVISSFSSNESVSERFILLDAGMNGISDSPLFGDYLGQYRDFGNFGSYIHNALSVAQQFGIFEFSLYMYLCITTLLVSLLAFRLAREDSFAESLVYMAATSLIAVCAAKPIGWPFPCIAWGMACIMLSRKSPTASVGSYPQARQICKVET